LAEGAIGRDRLSRFGAAAGARLRQFRRRRDQMGDKVGIRPLVVPQDPAFAGLCRDRNQSIAQRRLLSRNGTLETSRSRRRKRRAAKDVSLKKINAVAGAMCRKAFCKIRMPIYRNV
jgi:hypothetical protein